MGLEHGVYCFGCCWVMMGLLFYGGIMNLAWIGGLALYVLIEKIVPPGHWITMATGWALILAGGVTVVAAL
jgi:predicted metal-binding membrane protein